MNSQVNNQNEKQEMLQEDQFRNVFFDSSKRTFSTSSPSDTKRARLEAPAPSSKAPPAVDVAAASSPSTVSSPTTATGPRKRPHSRNPSQHDLPILRKSSGKLPTASSTAKSKAPKFIRRFRSRSLPIIAYNGSASTGVTSDGAPPALSRGIFNTRFITNGVPSAGTAAAASIGSARAAAAVSSSSSASVSVVPPLPPINLQSLKEIDLHEILKNPQLRHDILFDPQLQFRPNLDGERGKRKKTIIDKYWNEIQKECSQFFVPSDSKSASPRSISRLPLLFATLRDILLSLLPYKDRQSVNDVMDIDLLIQQLSHGSFDFVSMARWLGEVFKSHCAPMRDVWVAEMINRFVTSSETGSVDKLVQGLRMIFQILEAMKLDVANHQIRILRPILIETAVDFEKDYFSQLIQHAKIDINDSLRWFYKSYLKNKANLGPYFDSAVSKTDDKNLKLVAVAGLINLLSCRNMATDFPSTLAFDHTRLILLRADIRQLVCVQLCVILYKQLVFNNYQNVSERNQYLQPNVIQKIQEEVLAIVTDDNGNVKWTRNVNAIAIQLTKNVVTPINPTSTQNTGPLPQSMIEFGCGWLMKQIQPGSDVYGLMEEKIFKEVLTDVNSTLKKFDMDSKVSLNDSKNDNFTNKAKNAGTEMSNIAHRIATLVRFHWSVFGSHYREYLNGIEAN
ncbi:hypothetical protein PGUG_04780 [Meyerozyma guilliermondii ATCC 6260]|uniref:Protein SOK1 n=1 Tax=Meyerozyma guilliermondii (strain ATCC 6260 / CBS 566 / DSM 6381 / JCM 1539 / NBRC 10279 / NRRL Y-324) TaxID=294746 RepID=A5DNC9_PICGU|nr:uncharacterized protein PGUG_04780 [Meyerozyma guilliermondii ATCC 6260]EDK40682.2 hypothetical protein PGUG_04780 [Meyerozyma guilliermondii ATCC 6260]